MTQVLAAIPFPRTFCQPRPDNPPMKDLFIGMAGGAVAGMSAGFAVGGPIGAVIAGVVLSGVFGALSAQNTEA
jgi:hypothetical protein